MTRIPSELEELARACGVLTCYEDVYQRRRKASVASLLAGLNALGVPVQSLDDVPHALAMTRLKRSHALVEPVIVAWDGEPAEFDLTLPVPQAAGKIHCEIELEDGSEKTSQEFDLDRINPRLSPCGQFATRRLRMARRLDWGYYRLTMEKCGKTSAAGAPSAPAAALVISAPRRAYADEQSQGVWGVFLPLYALRSQRNWGAGDFTDLQHLADWTANLGGSVVGTLPLLAAFLDDPCEPSPYAPASRLAWNEFYIDVARIPELANCPRASERVQSSAFVEEISQLRKSRLVDYRRVMAAKRNVLEMLADAFFAQKPQPRYNQFEQFLARHPHVEDYAAFRAVHERRRKPWSQWPDLLRGGDVADGEFDRADKQYHLFVQWIATSHLEALADARRGGLYLDLPLGVRPDGYDVWRYSDAYALGASAGSPPDAMWTKGQNWCFPPLHPDRIREQGYRHVRDYVTHHLQLARLLRIDHVMQLHRLYWIPQGMPADQGVYVRYRPNEFCAILNLESHRCQTTLIGENLGTVPPEVDEAMDRHGMKRMYVVQYEVAAADNSRDTGRAVADAASAPSADARLREPAVWSEIPAGSLASLNTHDMPTFAAWWRGAEIGFRKELGLLNASDAERELDQLQSTKARLTAWLQSAGLLEGVEAGEAAILQAILKHLAASPAGVVLINLEDLWLETQPQNVPGTGPELPNWKRKAAVAFDEFARHPDIVTLLQQVADLRQQAKAAL